MKVKLKQVMLVEYSDLENQIQEYYGVKEFSVPGDQECGNDVSLTFDLNFTEELDEWEKDDIKKFKAGQYVTYITRTLMQDMVNEYQIPVGNYVVDICW